MPDWYRHDAASRTLTLQLHVQPNARTSGFAGLHGDALRVKIAAPAVDNKANAALVELLHRTLDVPARAIELRHGSHGRRKIVAIANADERLIAKLQTLAQA